MPSKFDSRIYTEAAARAKPLANLYEGERVIIAHPPGLEFSVAVHACMKAGLVFCPVYPPREGADSARLIASAKDCGAKHALTTASALRTMRLAALASGGLAQVLRVIKWHVCPHGANVTRFTPVPNPPVKDPLAGGVVRGERHTSAFDPRQLKGTHRRLTHVS